MFCVFPKTKFNLAKKENLQDLFLTFDQQLRVHLVSDDRNYTSS